MSFYFNMKNFHIKIFMLYIKILYIQFLGGFWMHVTNWLG